MKEEHKGIFLLAVVTWFFFIGAGVCNQLLPAEIPVAGRLLWMIVAGIFSIILAIVVAILGIGIWAWFFDPNE